MKKSSFVYSILFTALTLLAAPAALAQDRGGHCQQPSCIGARIVNMCGGKWTCAIGFVLVKDTQGNQLCVKEGSPSNTKCRDGKDVTGQE